MTIKEQLEKMFRMQKALNENILKEFGKESITEEKLELAIIDELGELTHELKGDWCWWKKSQAQVNRQRVLEELVDIYHFVMTYELMYGNTSGDIKDILEFYKIEIEEYEEDVSGLALHRLISIVAFRENKLMELLELSRKLNFTFDEIYQEYLNKNKINYERLENGY